MTYQQRTYFYYAAKTLNFSKAAQLCFVAQTAISKQLELTPAGDNLRVYA